MPFVKRAEGQTLLTVAVDQKLLSEIDRARGFENRSTYIRQMLCKHLNLDASYAAAPDRTGKGGKPTHKSKALEPVAGSGEAKQNKVAG